MRRYVLFRNSSGDTLLFDNHYSAQLLGLLVCFEDAFLFSNGLFACILKCININQ